MPHHFIADLRSNRHNRAILDRWPALALPDGWLVAGCLFQTVWNLRSGRPPEADIKDYDIFYFDAGDLTEAGERAVQARVEAVVADLGITVEVANQARVHLWYPGFFGEPYPALENSRDGIDRFLVACTCVGVRPDGCGPIPSRPTATCTRARRRRTGRAGRGCATKARPAPEPPSPRAAHPPSRRSR